MKPVHIIFAILLAGAIFAFLQIQKNVPDATEALVNSRQSSLATAVQAQRQTNAPLFTATTLDEQTIGISGDQKKTTILYFFTTWDTHSVSTLDSLQAIQEKYGDTIELWGINLQERTQDVERFIKQNDITFPVAIDTTGRISNIYGVQYTNTSIVVDHKGVIQHVLHGPITDAESLGL